jgi:Spy/CpxP family protein refolding chaperone
MSDTARPDDANMPVSGSVVPPSRSRRTGWIVAAVIAAGLTGAAATSAFSHGMGFGPGGWHGRFMGGPLDPKQIEDRADRMVRHLAIEIDATNEQQEKLRNVVKGAVKDILPMREKAQAARARARELLTQDKIDRAEIEKFRNEQATLADAFSKRVAQAIGDAAEILSPEQRRKIADRLPPPGRRGHGFGPGFGPGSHWNR